MIRADLLKRLDALANRRKSVLDPIRVVLATWYPVPWNDPRCGSIEESTGAQKSPTIYASDNEQFSAMANEYHEATSSTILIYTNASWAPGHPDYRNPFEQEGAP